MLTNETLYFLSSTAQSAAALVAFMGAIAIGKLQDRISYYQQCKADALAHFESLDGTELDRYTEEGTIDKEEHRSLVKKTIKKIKDEKKSNWDFMLDLPKLVVNKYAKNHIADGMALKKAIQNYTIYKKRNLSDWTIIFPTLGYFLFILVIVLCLQELLNTADYKHYLTTLFNIFWVGLCLIMIYIGILIYKFNKM